MSEPVLRRTQSANTVQALRVMASRLSSPLAKALSLCGVLSVLSFAAPLHADSTSGDSSLYSIESAEAAQSLLLDITRAGKRLVAVGDRGHILFSDDEGATWQQAKVPTNQLLTAVFFVDDRNGWATGHDAQIIASTDGGATWTLQHKDLEREEGAPFLDIWFKDANNGFAVGAYNALFETTDGGKNWLEVSERIDNPDGYHLNAITAVKDAGLFVVGELGLMFRSADWGQTWERVEGPYEGTLFGALGTAQASTLVVYGLRGNLFHSGDFGSTWQAIDLKTGSGSLEFGLVNGSLLPDGTLVVVGHGGSVLQSTNNGRSFTVLNRPDRLSLAGVTADGKGNLILVGQGGVHAASPTGANLGQQ